jgi:uncharacterized Zn finger protein
MLFSIKQFEHFFTESLLKEGLRVFQKGAVQLLERAPGNELSFGIGSERLFLKRQGDKLVSYRCSCHKKYYCRHLAAVMFYFQKDALQILTGGKQVNKAERGELSPMRLFQHALRETSSKELKKSLLTIHDEIDPKDVNAIFEKGEPAGDHELFSLLLRVLVKPYLGPDGLEQNEIDHLLEELTSLYKKNTRKTA